MARQRGLSSSQGAGHLLYLIVPHGQGDLAADSPVVRSCSHCRAILCRPLRLGTIVSGCSAILPFSNRTRLSKREARPPVPRSCPAINLLIHLSRTCDCRSFPRSRQFPAVYLRKCHALSFSVLPIALVQNCCGQRKCTGCGSSSRGRALTHCLYPPDISWSLYGETGIGSHWHNDLTAVSTSCCSWSRTGSRA